MRRGSTTTTTTTTECPTTTFNVAVVIVIVNFVVAFTKESCESGTGGDVYHRNKFDETTGQWRCRTLQSLQQQ
jgi:hypothetical protein